ncbi:MAG: DUF2079 domain-containing protein [Acidimicrobiales bacterium]
MTATAASSRAATSRVDAHPGSPPIRRAPQPLRRASRWIERTNTPARITIVGTFAWIAWLYLDVWRRHDRFGSFDYDLGLHTQYLWLLSHGRSFSSITGMPAFGHNVTLGYLLFIPFGWLGAGAQFLDFVQTAALGAAVIPIYRLARRRFASDWTATLLAAVFLLNPVVLNLVFETFHPEVMAVAPLLGAVDAAEDKRWGRFAWLIGFALLWKVDVALFVFMLGFRVWRRHSRRAGIATVVTGFTWFVLCTSVIIPHFSNGHSVFGPLYGDLGETPLEVAKTSVTDPGRVVDRLETSEPDRYARDLLTPYGFVPLLAPGSLVLAAPQVAVDLLSYADFTRDFRIGAHYQALPTVALMLGLLDGLARLRRRRPQNWQPVITALCACTLATSVAWSALPAGVQRPLAWSAKGEIKYALRQAMLDAIDDDAGASAPYYLVPHLADREFVYTFPNPWRPSNYGVPGTPPARPTDVRFLVIDQATLNADSTSVAQCVTASGAFERIIDGGALGIELWWRVDGHDEDIVCAEVR